MVHSWCATSTKNGTFKANVTTSYLPHCDANGSCIIFIAEPVQQLPRAAATAPPPAAAPAADVPAAATAAELWPEIQLAGSGGRGEP